MSIDPTHSSFDVIVIGGGITGAGIARDAALRGLSCLLLEKGDFASGASSRTSRLLRGGALSVGRAGLAPRLHTVHERALLARMAPHLVHPVSILRPVYRGDPRGLWRYRVGMQLGETLSLGKTPPHQGVIDPAETLRRAPFLPGEGLKGAGVFWDYQLPFPERLVLENVFSAREHGACCLNYCEVVDIGEAEKGLWVTARWPDGRTVRFSGGTVVNAAGAWADEVTALLRYDAPPKVSLQKVTHVFVSWDIKQGFLSTGSVERGPLFALPIEGMCIVGVSSRQWSGSPSALLPDVEEVRSLLETLRRAAPGWDSNHQGALWACSAIYAEPTRGSRTPVPSLAPRHRLFQEGSSGRYFTDVGGDVTTYRRRAEDAVDAVCGVLGHPIPSSTDRVPLSGGGFRDPVVFRESLCECTRRIPDVPRELVDHLVEIYGRRCCEVIELALLKPELWKPIAPGYRDIQAQVIYAIRSEDSHTLEDVMLRRLRLGISADRGLAAAEAAAEIMASELGWDRGKVRAQVTAFRDRASSEVASTRLDS